MAQTALNEEIKTRVPEAVKRLLEAEADRRELDLSDIVREALREYLARRPAQEPAGVRGAAAL